MFGVLGIFGAKPLKIEWRLENGAWAVPYIAVTVLQDRLDNPPTCHDSLGR